MLLWYTIHIKIISDERRTVMKIGIFDSGIGGLSVLHRARKMLPGAQFIYYADEKHVPYGEKTPEEIRVFIGEIFSFMIERRADAIVIACNTATSAVTREYRNSFPVPIIGMEPAVKKAVDLYGDEDRRILVAATPITIKGQKLHELVERVDTRGMVDLIELPALVRFAEKGMFESGEAEEYLRSALSGYELSDYGTIVLGCTHFNYFKRSFRRIFGEDIRFTDGNEGTVKQVQRLLPDCEDMNEAGGTEFYFSGERVDAEQMAFIGRCMAQLDSVFEIE